MKVVLALAMGAAALAPNQPQVVAKTAAKAAGAAAHAEPRGCAWAAPEALSGCHAKRASRALTSAVRAWPAGRCSARRGSGLGRARPQRVMQRARWHAVIAVAPPQLEAAAATLLRT